MLINDRCKKLLAMAGIWLVAFSLEWIYRESISTVLETFGFPYFPPSIGMKSLSWIFCIVPVLWMPMGIRRPTQVIYWLLYITVYVPSIMIPLFLREFSNQDVILCSAVLMVGLGITGLFYRLPLITLGHKKFSTKTFIGFFFALYLVALAIVLYTYGSHLRLAAFGDHMQVRLEARNIPSSVVATYSLAYLAWVFNPMLMCFGLFRKKVFPFIVGAMCQLLLYSVAASRAWILTVLYIPLIFLWVKKFNRASGLVLVWCVAALFLLFICVDSFSPSLAAGPIFLIVLRVFVNSGFMTSTYAQFFSENAITFGSHIRGVSLLVDYPYDVPLPFLIGRFLGSEENSANAHIWADGIASFGLWGVIVVSIVLGVLFLCVDSAAHRLNSKVVSVAIVAQSVVLSNLGLSSAFFGGGIGLLVIMMMLMPRGITTVPQKRCSARKECLSIRKNRYYRYCT
jgi:hypothetical protein